VAAAIIGFGVIAAAFRNADNPGARPVAIILLLVTVGAASALVSWLYYAWMESSASQGTLGKLALGLYVTDMQGRRISFGRASGRFFAKIITGLIPFFLGYILAGITEKKQALHDMIASCLVLRKN
ncbi:MAG: RDD family protein, partial [Candidatus Binataceae bacterium]